MQPSTHRQTGPQPQGEGAPWPSPRPRRSGPNRMVLILALLLALAVAAAGSLAYLLLGGRQGDGHGVKAAGSAIAIPPTITMIGTIHLELYSDADSEQYKIRNWQVIDTLSCGGNGGYGDMAEGASVTVYDDTGKIAGVGTLGKGERGSAWCTWGFSVAGLPDAPYYQVEISHRGKIAVKRADVGTVTLSLG